MGVEFADVRALTDRDVALLLQWMAPRDLLGVAPAAPRVRREDVLAVTLGGRDQTLDYLDDLLAAAIGSHAEVVIKNPVDGSEPVSFFLDLPGHPEWSPLASTDDRLELALEGLPAASPST